MKGLIYQRTLFPAPAAKVKTISYGEIMTAKTLTFPVQPQEGTWAGMLPL